MKNEYLLGLSECLIVAHLVTPPDINIYQKVTLIDEKWISPRLVWMSHFWTFSYTSRYKHLPKSFRAPSLSAYRKRTGHTFRVCLQGTCFIFYLIILLMFSIDEKWMSPRFVWMSNCWTFSYTSRYKHLPRSYLNWWKKNIHIGLT